MKEKNKTQEILKLAVKRMLPGGVLGKKQLTKLKIYSGNEHPHVAQNPKIIELDKLIIIGVCFFKNFYKHIWNDIFSSKGKCRGYATSFSGFYDIKSELRKF